MVVNMAKYIILRRNDGSIWSVRVCHTEEQLGYYSKLYSEHGEIFTVEEQMPILDSEAFISLVMKADERYIKLFLKELTLAQKFIEEKNLTIEFFKWKEGEKRSFGVHA